MGGGGPRNCLQLLISILWCQGSVQNGAITDTDMELFGLIRDTIKMTIATGVEKRKKKLEEHGEGKSVNGPFTGGRNLHKSRNVELKVIRKFF